MKTTNKILAIILAILMVISIIPLTASAADPTSGTCGENITWEFDVATRILTISGTGNMNDYLKSNRPSFETYKSQIETVIINDGVIQIGTCAFYNYTNLKNVTISDGVKVIGTSAFYGCTNLTSIVIPDSVTAIDSNSFGSCTNLADITIPDSVTSIGYGAFANTAYYNDESNWESNVLYIGNHLYQAKYTIVGNGVIKNGTKTIADNSFMGCENLTNITIPNSVKTIGESVFFNCDSLVTVTIPDSVEVIGEEAFSLCDNLQSIIVDVNNQYYSSDEYGVLFNKDKSTLIQYPGGNKQTNYLIPDTVSEIVAWAFGHAYDLASITIPDSVTTIGEHAFYYCSSLTKVKIGNGLTDTGNWVFGKCDSLVTVTIPDNITRIGDYAFYQCDNLTNVIIGKNLTSIGWAAFNECANIRNVYYSGTQNQWNTIAIDGCNDGLIYATIYYNSAEKLTSGPCGYNLTWTFDESTGTLTISGTGKMYDDIHRYYPSWHGYISSIESVVISQGVTTIGDSAFYNHENIKNVSIADSVTIIGSEAFYNCTGLSDVIIGKGVKTIGDWAFYNCKGLTDVVIGKGVTVIGDYAFDRCSNLKTVTIYNDVETIGEYSFNCSELTDVYYFGTEAEWNAISKGSIIYGIITGTGLEKATIHFLGEETHECSYNAVVTPPTCTEQGYTTYTCVCGDSFVDNYVDALGHDIVIDEAIAPDCVNVGLTEGSHCSRCDDVTTVQNVVPALGHTYAFVVTAPTCTKQGYTTYTCECGDIYVDDYVDATGHSYTSEITTPATHLTTGVMTYTCTCGDSYTEVIAKLEKHDYESVVTAPTCTEQGYTTYTCECGYSYVDDYVDALGHTEETISAVAPTCTEKGLTAGTKCSVCGETLTEQKELPANGHNYNDVVTAPTCTEQGYTTYTCKCGDSYIDDYVDALGHIPADVLEENYVSPTCTESGSKDVVVYCSACDEEISRKTETLDASGHADNDGDGYCDNCDFQICDHRCHNNGFIWKIIRFINKIFGTNKYCECGVAHH